MAHTIRSHPEHTPAELRRGLALLAWTVFVLIVAGLLVYGFVRARGSTLRVATANVALPSTPGAVRTYGTLADLTHGNSGPKVSLAALPGGRGTVGVGSLSGLRGEIAVVRGVTWLSYAVDSEHARGELYRGGDYQGGNEAAGFLALADVPAWNEQTLPKDLPFDRLAAELEDRAARAGLDTGEPFALTIDGSFSAIEMNVVNGKALGSSEPTDERLKETAIKLQVPNAEGTVVGFFAKRHGDAFIHPDQRFHLHIVLPSSAQVGHLDSATIRAGATLRLPKAP